jgi:hypothetical protein
MSYMNCQELKTHFESSPLLGGDPSAEPSLADHIAGCPKCSRFIGGQKELRASLAFLRESASLPSAALDETVLANYRKHHAGLHAGRIPKHGLRLSIRLAFGVAAGIALVTIFLWPGRQSAAPIQPVISPPVISSTRLEPTQNVAVPHRSSHEKRNDAVKRTQSAVSSTSMGDSIPEGFRSLMYCDELSCGGAMDVVRIELQPSDVGLMATAQQDRNAISADVLVGADGIARGIRIVR